MAKGKPTKLRVLVIDANDEVRQDIVALLESHGCFEVLGGAETLGQAIQIARTGRPEIVLVDVEMAQGNGIDILRDLKLLLPSTALIVATHCERDEYEAAARAAGAASSVAKTRLFDGLVPAIEEAFRSAEHDRGEVCDGNETSSADAATGTAASSASFTSTGIWWKPTTWREWLDGVAAFSWALVRGAPMDSDLPASYWRYVEAAMAIVVLLVATAYLGSGFRSASLLVKALVLAILAALVWEECRRIRRLTSATRAITGGEHPRNNDNENPGQTRRKGGEKE